jgi:uncharacterized membrane protein YkvA (DUF1232 family)
MSSDFDNTKALQLIPAEMRKSTGKPSSGSGQLRGLVKNPKRLARFLYDQLYLLFRVLKDPETPWTAKLVAGVSVGYVFSPIQLIPSFIPIIGQVDDAVVAWLGMRIVRKCAGETLVAKHLATLHEGRRQVD